MNAIPFHLPDIGIAEIDGVVECLHSGWLTAGVKVKEFEEKFAHKVGARFAISCNSATTAALLLMEALGVKLGGQVVVPTWTFSGPAMMAHKLGAQVMLTDVDENFMMTRETLLPAITNRTSMIMPTHFAGRACDLHGLVHGFSPDLIVVDDAAHAFPARDVHGHDVGSQHRAAATFFSFYATKTLTTAEGGMITTNNPQLAETLRRSRSHGIDRDVHDRYTNPGTGWSYDIASEGWKANMTDVNAAIGLGQLARAHSMTLARTLIAESYTNAFRDLETEGEVICPRPVNSNREEHAWHLYSLRVLHGRRGRFIELMQEQGVQCSVHFIPLHKHSFWRNTIFNLRDQFPVADRLFREVVSLPIYSKMTRGDVDRVIVAVRKALAEC